MGEIRFSCYKELTKYHSYEEYLESLITPRDLFHLRSKVVARQIIELGYHTKETLDRETFEDRVEKVRRYVLLKENPYALCSESLDLKDVLLQELSLREKPNRNGEMYTIIFLRHIDRSNSQISVYIDYNARLISEDWLPYFETTKKITPRKNDLSYYNWKSRHIILNKSKNFMPVVNKKQGLLFQNVHDLKFIDPSATFNPRTVVYSDLYGPVTLYDHILEIQEETHTTEN